MREITVYLIPHVESDASEEGQLFILWTFDP